MMDANGMKHEAKLAGWTARVEECRKSGLSVREWRTERGVSVATYYRWEREVLNGMDENGNQGKTDAETRFVEIPELGTGDCRGRMVAEMETAKARIRVYEGADAEVVRTLCEAASCRTTSPERRRFYIAYGYTDMRLGIDGLAGIVEREFHPDPFSNSLFLFCGRKRDRIKGLYWERNGFVLLYKRLEEGIFQWPRNKREAKLLTPQQYRWLMECLKVEQPHAHKLIHGLRIT